MSKGVIGGVVGATIGFFAGGNVALGWSIGYSAGSSYDVTKLPGLGDASAVEAGEGGPRFRFYGGFRPVGGQTIAVGPEVETRVRQRSKGGAPVESSRALRTYAIGFGEGPASFSRIWEDTVLVYDARPNPDIPWAESLRWAENVAFYSGDFEQNADPSLQEALGSDKVHGHRGTIYFVKRLEDYTDRGRRLPAYQAEIFRGAARVVTSTPYPVQVIESVSAGFSPLSGDLRRVFYEEELTEAVGAEFSPLSGALLESIFEEELTESVESEFTPLDGELRLIVKTTELTESLDSGFTPLSGLYKRQIIPYENYAPEGAEASFTPLGGSLS